LCQYLTCLFCILIYHCFFLVVYFVLFLIIFICIFLLVLWIHWIWIPLYHSLRSKFCNLYFSEIIHRLLSPLIYLHLIHIQVYKAPTFPSPYLLHLLIHTHINLYYLIQGLNKYCMKFYQEMNICCTFNDVIIQFNHLNIRLY